VDNVNEQEPSPTVQAVTSATGSVDARPALGRDRWGMGWRL